MSTQWVSVDQARLVPARDEAVCSRFAAAVDLSRGLSLSSRGTLHEMRDCAAGQPQAAKTEPNGGGSRTWCRTHERELSRCDVDDELEGECIPELIPHHSDPTGEAGIGKDEASRHYREHLRDMALVSMALGRMKARTALYPSEAVEPETVGEEGPDEMWCQSCWRAGKHHQPIDHRNAGKGEPYYRGLCRWCGDFKKANGFLPSPEILDMHHRGIRITSGMVEVQARREASARTKNRKGKKQKMKDADRAK